MKKTNRRMKLWIGIVIVLVLIVIIVITIAIIRKRNKEKTPSATPPIDVRENANQAILEQLPDNMIDQIKAKLANCHPSTLQKISELLQV